MRFTLVAALLSCIALSTAHISDIDGPGTYVATQNSTYPIQFLTEDLDGIKDFSVAIGVDNSTGVSQLIFGHLGNFVQNYDLVSLGLSSANSTFTQNVPLPLDSFHSGNSNYSINAAVTYGNGTTVGLNFFEIIVSVTA